MKKTWLLLLAALLPLAVSAQTQNGVTPEAGAQGAQEQAWTQSMAESLEKAIAAKDMVAIERITLDYGRRVMTGMKGCGHVIDGSTIFDGVAANDSHELATVIRWLDPQSSAAHSAVFTKRQRCVAVSGMTLDGKSIVRVLPNSLGVSGQHAIVAFEAEYWDSPAEGRPGVAPHRGIFIEHLFVGELDQAKASPAGKRELDDKDRDFLWKDDPETIAVKPGIAFNPAFAQSAKAAANVTTPCPAVKTPSFLDKLKQRAERNLTKEAQKADAATVKATGGALDGGASDAATSVVAQANAPNPCPPVKGQGK